MVESWCTVSQCVDHLLPAIVRSSTKNQHSILENLKEFSHVFRQTLNAPQEEPCQRRHFMVRLRYKKKELGLKMLFSIRKWLVYLTNINYMGHCNTTAFS
ncbi:hypothetical protein NQD34_006758 [Periophthalmus magnuspinnatus]|nr:hypothetical protein NQD34_006758 [Periophthalmus magnuspinnatus]